MKKPGIYYTALGAGWGVNIERKDGTVYGLVNTHGSEKAAFHTYMAAQLEELGYPAGIAYFQECFN